MIYFLHLWRLVVENRCTIYVLIFSKMLRIISYWNFFQKNNKESAGFPWWGFEPTNLACKATCNRILILLRLWQLNDIIKIKWYITLLLPFFYCRDGCVYRYLFLKKTFGSLFSPRFIHTSIILLSSWKKNAAKMSLVLLCRQTKKNV